MAQITQYFEVKISSPKPFKNEKVDTYSMDVTTYIETGVTLFDEDGLIKELTFDMSEGFLFMDVLTIGMEVSLIAGDLDRRDPKFNGFIKSITPTFMSNGDVLLKISASSSEGGTLGVAVKDLIYPSNNHPKAWARKDVTYSEIITSIAKDANIRVLSKNIRVLKDIKAGFDKGAIRQLKKSDWSFMQMLAEKINCTLWTTEVSGNSYLHLVDNSSLVSKISSNTFYFLSRKQRSEFIDYTVTSPKQIQIIECVVNLDTRNASGKIKQITDPVTGDTKLVNDVVDEATGNVERWVLDEAKVNKLSPEERNNLMQLFMSGKITWDGDKYGASAKQYFKKVLTDGSTREGESNNIEVEIAGGELKEDGITTQNSTTENTGSKAYKTVIDSEKISKLSPEKKSAIIGRIARGEMTEADKDYYKVVDTTPRADVETPTNALAQNTQAGVDAKKGKAQIATDSGKRDAGFNITAKIYGNLDVHPRMSYNIEGLGKYSGTYYLYKITETWGTKGFMADLVFTK